MYDIIGGSVLIVGSLVWLLYGYVLPNRRAAARRAAMLRHPAGKGRNA